MKVYSSNGSTSIICRPRLRLQPDRQVQCFNLPGTRARARSWPHSQGLLVSSARTTSQRSACQGFLQISLLPSSSSVWGPPQSAGYRYALTRDGPSSTEPSYRCGRSTASYQQTSTSLSLIARNVRGSSMLFCQATFLWTCCFAFISSFVDSPTYLSL